MRVLKDKKLYYCIILFTSVWLSLVSFLDTSPAERTLSSIGGENALWFIFWGIFACLSVYTQLNMLSRKLKYEKKWFRWMIIIGSCAVVVTSIINGPETWQSLIHWTTGIVFGVLSVLGCLILFSEKKRVSNGSFPYITLVVLSCVFTISSIMVWGLTALCQIVILIICQLLLFRANYFDKSLLELDNVSRACGNVESMSVD